jgi:hypothetical protein
MARKLDIKNLVPRKNGMYRQGYFKAVNPQKYIGDPGKIIFRSAWEKRFATYCDVNEKVVAWSSESVQVPYHNPVDHTQKIYNLDFYLKVRQPDGTDKHFIAEVKPAKKLVKPVLPATRLTEKRVNAHILQMKEYAVNMYKFQAAKEWAEARGWEFIIVTENFLF